MTEIEQLRRNTEKAYNAALRAMFDLVNVIEHSDKNAIVENVIEWLHTHTAMSEYEYELMRRKLEE